MTKPVQAVAIEKLRDSTAFGRGLRRLAALATGRVGPGNLRAGDKGAQVVGHGTGFFSCQRQSERRHAPASPFQDCAHDLGIRTARLPVRVGEIRDIGNVPDAAAVYAMATDAESVIKSHGDSPFLLWTP